MNYFCGLLVLVFVALVFLGFKVYFQNRKAVAYRIFAIYSIMTAVTLVFRIYASFDPAGISEKILWATYLAANYANMGSLFVMVHFILSLSGVGKKYIKFIFILMFIPVLVFLIAVSFEGTFARGFSLGVMGYSVVYVKGAWSNAFSIFSSVVYLSIIIICSLWYRNAKDFLERRQAGFILLTNIFIFSLGAYVYGFLTRTDYKYIPFVSSGLQISMLLLYAYAFMNYRLLHQPKDIAAKNVIMNMDELFFLVDARDNSIIEVNISGRKAVGLKRKEIVGKSIAGFIGLEGDLIRHLVEPERMERIKYMKSFLITASGRRVPVEISISPVMEKEEGFRGYILVVNDVSEMLSFIEKQRIKNVELKNTYDDVQKQRVFLERFRQLTWERNERKNELIRELESFETGKT